MSSSAATPHGSPTGSAPGSSLGAPPAAAPEPGAWPARVLGYAGLIPFVVITGLLLFAGEVWYAAWLMALAQYGALILAFVGALHWGYAVRGRAGGLAALELYAWSVLPALVGWAALQFPVWSALRLEAGMFAACLAMDLRAHRHERLPGWFLRMRVINSVVAVACLLTASYV